MIWPRAVKQALMDWQTADLTPIKEYFLPTSEVLISIKGDRGRWICTLFEQVDGKLGNLLHRGELLIYEEWFSLEWIGIIPSEPMSTSR